MGLCKSLRWSLLWIFVLTGFIIGFTEGANVRRVYRRNGNYGRRILPEISSVLQTPSRHFRVREPIFVAEETRNIGSVIPRPSNQLGLPAIDRQDQLAEETESSGYSYATPEATTSKAGYSYKRPAPIGEITEADNPEEEVDQNETPEHSAPEVEAEIPDQEPAFGLVSTQEVDSEKVEPDTPPVPVEDSPIAEFNDGSNSHSDSDSKCNENDHDCWPHGYKGVIRGEAGTDYPILTEIIPTSFDCNNVKYSGYYADTDEQARCQIFHICLRRNRHRRTQQWSFLCPNGTVFDQGNFVCVWWDMAPECNRQTVEPLYDLNAALGWDNITETEFDVNSVMTAMGDSQMSRNFENNPFQQSSSRLKNTIVEKPTTRKPRIVMRTKVRSKVPSPQQQQSRNAYRIPVRVSDGVRDRTALKPVTNNIGDYPEAEHDSDESSTYETSLRTEQQTEARFKTKSASALHKSQSEAYEEKSNPDSITPFIINNRRPYVDREDEATTETYENTIPTVVMMPTQQRFPDGSEGVVNVPVVIMKPKLSQLKSTGYPDDNEAIPPETEYLPPSKTTEEYDPVEQPLPASTSASQYLPPVTEVIPPSTEEAQYDQEIDQQSPQPVYTDDPNTGNNDDPNSEIDEGYKYPKPPRQILHDPVAEVTTTESSGYRYRRPTTTAEPVYIQQEEDTTAATIGYKYRRPTTTAEPVYVQEEATTTKEAEGYRYRRPSTRQPEYIKQEEPEVSTQVVQEEYSTTERAREYLPPKQRSTEAPAGTYLPPTTESTTGGYLPPKQVQTEPPAAAYLPPKQETAESSTDPGYLPPKREQTTQSAAYLPPAQEQTTKSPAYLPPKQEQATKPPAYLPPKQEQATERVVEATDLPTTQEARITTTVPAAYLPPKSKEEEGYSYPKPTVTQNDRTTTTETSSNAYLPPKKPDEQNSQSVAASSTQEARSTTEASSPGAYLPPKSPDQIESGGTNAPATGRAITQKISSVAVEKPNPDIVLPGVDTLKESSEETDTTEEQSSEEANEVTNPAKEDITEKYHLPTPSTPLVTSDSEDLGTPSQLYNANVRQQLYAKNKNNKPGGYEENVESQERINEIIRQLQAGVAEAEDSNGKKIDFAQFAKLNTKIALVVPQRNGTSQTAQTLIFDTSTETVTEALSSVPSSVSPSLETLPTQTIESPSPSSETLPYVETFIQNPFKNGDFHSNTVQVHTPQYEINVPTKEFESHSVENSIEYDRKQNRGNQQQFSGQYEVQRNNFPQIQVQQQQPQISNYIQPQVSVQNPTIQNPVLSTVLYNQPNVQPQNFILPISSPAPQQFNPQQLFFQSQSQSQQLQEPVYSPPLPPPVPQPQQQNFVQQNFVQQSPAPQQNTIPQRNNFVQQAPPQQNFVQQTSQQQNFIQTQTSQQQNFVQQNNYRAPQSQIQEIFRSPQPSEIYRSPPQEPEIFHAPAQQQREEFRPQIQQQTEIFRPQHQQQQQNFQQSQPQKTVFNQHQGQQIQTDNRYLPPGPPSFQQNEFRHQFQQPQGQATISQPQIVDFQAAKTPELDSIKTPKKLINPADIKIVPAIFVHHHTRVENPDGSLIQDDSNAKQTPQSESRPHQQQSFQSAGFYESPQQNVNKFRNSNYLSYSAQQTENVPVAVSAPKVKPSSLPPPPSPSNVFSPQEGIGAPSHVEKFTLDDARTAEQLQPYHRENLRNFVPVKPTHQSSETSTAFIGTGSSGRLDMSPEQSSIADASRFYPGRDNSLGVKLTYE